MNEAIIWDNSNSNLGFSEPYKLGETKLVFKDATIDISHIDKDNIFIYIGKQI